jgi:hypothetical protein
MEVVAAKFTAVIRLHAGTEENYGKFREDRRSTGRGLTSVPPEYEAGLLATSRSRASAVYFVEYTLQRVMIHTKVPDINEVYFHVIYYYYILC